MADFSTKSFGLFYYVLQIPILREISGSFLLAYPPNNIWRDEQIFRVESEFFFLLIDSRPVEQKIDGSWARRDYICNTILASVVRGLEGSWRSSSPPQKSERTNGLQGTRCFNKSCSSAVWYWQCDQIGAQVRSLTYYAEPRYYFYKLYFVIW